MNRKKLLKSILRGNVNNIGFADLVNLVEGLGFVQERVAGSHHIFRHLRLGIKLNLQPAGAQAKSYQVRQLAKVVEKHAIELKE
ncbi:MAG: hypothetical protein BIFFINMI_02063 [Phycisphaerae bacterium]|nr:hypothetical protein [Phycisphaerae bacterium]